jgi:hypothetical protein
MLLWCAVAVPATVQADLSVSPKPQHSNDHMLD